MTRKLLYPTCLAMLTVNTWGVAVLLKSEAFRPPQLAIYQMLLLTKKTKAQKLNTEGTKLCTAIRLEGGGGEGGSTSSVCPPVP